MNVEVVVKGGLGDLGLSALQLQDVAAQATTRLIISGEDLKRVLARLTGAGLHVVAVAEFEDQASGR